MTARTCIDCAGPISRVSKGRCRPCSAARMNNCQDVAARRALSLIATLARPDVRERRIAALREAIRNISPEERERRRAAGRWVAANVLARPDVMERSHTPEARAQAGRANTNKRLAWCPPELRDTYRDLIRKKGLTSAQARAALEPEIPGTVAHAHRLIENTHTKQQLRRERERREAY